MRKIILLGMLLIGLLAANNFDSVNLAVNVVGNTFTLELQDASAFPAAGAFDLGSLAPGSKDFPVTGVIVAGCKSNSGRQWYLQVEQTEPLSDPAKGLTLPEGSLLVRGLLSTRSPNGKNLPGNLVAAEQKVLSRPSIVYSSTARGDAGFNNYEGTYVPLNFGVKIPGAMPEGNYSGRVLLTLTE
ncbi:hypothetical protein NO1_1627 [Candidatus Termititenax aidoneus]|uniref:Uncharacterized protein n=1 Tax=Termititenax aidoneus TaxID=2218524 RepID=A0A388TC81_TERA1|nr:hypothetical protein NO1_1627 [Candidatus Termititenax aidoneus]